MKLHNGSLLVVNVKYTYQRLGGGLTLDKYEPSILRNTELSFDAGPPMGRFSQLFQKHRVGLIEYFNEKWYLLLQRRGGGLTTEVGGEQKEIWGSVQDAFGNKWWSLDGQGLHQASINELPDALLKINMLMDVVPVSVMATLTGKRVNLSMKSDLLSRYPLNPNDQRIARPPAAAAKP